MIKLVREKFHQKEAKGRTDKVALPGVVASAERGAQDVCCRNVCWRVCRRSGCDMLSLRCVVRACKCDGVFGTVADACEVGSCVMGVLDRWAETPTLRNWDYCCRHLVLSSRCIYFRNEPEIQETFSKI